MDQLIGKKLTKYATLNSTLFNNEFDFNSIDKIKTDSVITTAINPIDSIKDIEKIFDCKLKLKKFDNKNSDIYKNSILNSVGNLYPNPPNIRSGYAFALKKSTIFSIEEDSAEL